MAIHLQKLFNTNVDLIKSDNTGDTFTYVNTKQQVLRGVKQQAAGLVETFIGSPEAKGVERLVPNFLYGLYSLVGSGVESLINKDISSIGRAQELFTAGTDRANEIVGTDNPKNIVDVSNRIGLTALIPGKILPQAKTSSEIIKNTITDAILPLAQSKTKLGAFTSVALPTGLVEGINAVTKPKDFTNVVDLFNSNTEEIIQNDKTNPVFSNVTSSFNNSFNNIIDDVESSIYELDSQNVSKIIYGTLSILGAVGAYQGVKAIRDGKASNQIESDVIGTRDIDTQTVGIGTKLDQAIFDRQAPLLDLAQKYATKETFQQYKDLLQTSGSLQAQGRKIEVAKRTGELPFTNAKLKNPQEMFDTLGEMNPQLLNDFGESLIYGTIIDDLITNNKKSWKRNDSDGNLIEQVPLSDLIDRYNKLLQVPKINSATVMVRNVLDPTIQYRKDAGILSDEAALIEQQSRPNYATLRIDKNKIQNKFIDLAEKFKLITVNGDQSDLFNLFHKRDAINGVALGNATNPVRLIERYIDSVIQFTENNRLQRSFMDAISDGDTLPKGFKRITSKTSDKSNSIKYIDNTGTQRFVRVDDDSVRSAFNNVPELVFNVVNVPRKVYTAATTSYNPAFPPASIAYEMGTFMILREKGINVGIFDEYLVRRGLPAVSDVLPFDPTIILAPITGTIKGQYADTIGVAKQYINKQLRQQTRLVNILGETNTRFLANKLSETYLQTTKHLSNRVSGTNAVFADVRSPDEVSTQLNTISPEFFRRMETSGIGKLRANTLWRFYSSVLENMHNSIRIQAMASSIPKKLRDRLKDPAEIIKYRQETDLELTKIAAGIRRSGVDLSRQGNSTALQVLGTQNIPYFNVALQVGKAHALGLKNNFKQYLGGITAMLGGGATLLITQFESDPEAADFFYNKMTLSQRMNSIPVFANGKPVVASNVEPILSGLWGGLTEFIGVVFGYKDGLSKLSIDERMNKLTDEEFVNISSMADTAISRVLPDLISPSSGAVLTLLGTDPGQVRITEGRYSLGKPYSEKITVDGALGKGGRTTESLPQKAEILIEEFLGLTGRAVVNSAMTYNSLNNYKVDENKLMLETAKAFYRDIAETLPTSSPPMYDLDFKLSTNTYENKYIKDVSPMIKEISVRAPRQLSGFGSSGTSSKSYMTKYYLPDATFMVDPNTGNKTPTQLNEVLRLMGGFNALIESTKKVPLRKLYNEKSELVSNPNLILNPSEFRKEQNRITNEIVQINKELYNMVIDREEEISQRLDITFKFKDFDAEELNKVPYIDRSIR